MTEHEQCLTASDLIAYSTGRLATRDSTRIALHVERCPRCQTALEKIGEAPTVAHDVRQPEKPTYLAAPLEEGDLGSIEHYRVVEVLGQGGMGVVFKGIDTVLERPVAIKVLKDMAAPFAKERMLREAQATAGLSSEHVAAVYQVGQINGLPYLVMELLEGESLEDRLAEEKPRLDEALRWSCEIAEGLSAAHAKGLVHRDIKPANIWLLPSGKVKILDFGLSRSVDRDLRLTQTGFVVGTPHYMSPEQATDGPIDHRSDLFSLGCVMYRMVTGTLAFSGRSFAAVIAKLATFDPPPVTDQVTEAPQELSDLIQQLLSKKPERRPGRASDVVDRLRGLTRAGPRPALQSIDAGQTTSWARVAPSPPTRWSSWLVGGGSVLAVGLVGGVTWWNLGPASSPPADAIARTLNPAEDRERHPRRTPESGAGSPETTPSLPPALRSEPAKPLHGPWDVTQLEQFRSDLVGKPGLVYLAEMTPSAVDLSGRGPRPGEFRYPVVVGDVYSPRGIFQHGRSPWGSVSYRLGKKYARFWSEVAVNDSVKEGSCEPFTFYVYGDGKELWHSPKMTKTGVVHVCDIPVRGVEQLELLIYCEGSLRGTHGVWIEASVSEE